MLDPVTMLAIGATFLLAGMVVGQRIRRRLSEARFRQVFFIAILLLGAYIVGNAALHLS